MEKVYLYIELKANYCIVYISSWGLCDAAYFQNSKISKIDQNWS